MQLRRMLEIATELNAIAYEGPAEEWKDAETCGAVVSLSPANPDDADEFYGGRVVFESATPSTRAYLLRLHEFAQRIRVEIAADEQAQKREGFTG